MRGRWLRAAAAAALAVPVSTCRDPMTSGNAPVERVTIQPSSLSLAVGDHGVLRATTYDAAGAVVSAGGVFWSSGDETVATVSQTGEVTAVAAGTARIAASKGGPAAVAQVTVAAQPVVAVLSITLGGDSVIAPATLDGRVTLLDAGGGPLSGRLVQLTSSAPGVATVAPDSATTDQAGEIRLAVTAVAAGSAVVSAVSSGAGDAATVRVLAPVASVIVQPTSALLVTGETRDFIVLALDAAGAPVAGRRCQFVSPDTQVATVAPASAVTDAGGNALMTVTAGSTGVASISVACEGIVVHALVAVG